VADGTIDMEVKMAKAVINKAFDNEMISGKVLRVFKAFRNLLKVGSNIRDRVLSVNEAEALIAAATGDIKPVLIIAYENGMRRAAILDLTWDGVNVKDKIISLGETKNGRSKMVPMTERLFATLGTLPRGLRDKHVFLSNGKSIEEISMRRSIKAACKATGVLYGRSKDGFTLHNFRHSVNTDLRRAGVQESVINAISGHVDNTMFGTYNTIDLGDVRQAMSKLEAYRGSARQTVRQEAQAE
jgi:integrase